MPRPRIGSGVEQLLAVDAGRGRAGDVADVVGTRTLGHQADLGQVFQHGDGVVGGDLAHLQVGARRHMRIAVAIALGDVGDARQLPVRENAVRDAQAAHVGVLRRRHVEQPVEAPAEIVDALGILPLGALGLEPRVGIEGMLVALGLLFRRELLALRLEARHGRQMLGVRTGRLRRRTAADSRQRLQAGRRARGLHPRHEALEVALLLVGEILGAHHAASANAWPKASASRSADTGARERIRSAYHMRLGRIADQHHARQALLAHHQLAIGADARIAHDDAPRRRRPRNRRPRTPRRPTP